MSGMIMGGMLEADRHLRAHEARVRVQKRLNIDKATWEKYEQDYEKERAREAARNKNT